MTTREEWLIAATQELAREFDLKLTSKLIRLSVGFPKGTRKIRGQAWHQDVALDGKTLHIFIHPGEVDKVEVLRILLHELIHVEVGVQEGHRKAFSTRAKSVGFTKPWTSTPMTEHLAGRIETLAARLPDYPHVGLEPKVKIQTTRMRLWECECEPPVKIRRAGELNAQCLDCGSMFVKRED